jgi:hypothetical protein
MKLHGNSTFDVVIAQAILDCLMEGMSIKEIARFPGFPPENTIRWWGVYGPPEFTVLYAQARRIGYERWADELREIADEPQLGVEESYSDKDGRRVTMKDMLGHRQLRIDTRKWMLSKMIPKVYGSTPTTEEAVSKLADAIRQLAPPSTLPIADDVDPND